MQQHLATSMVDPNKNIKIIGKGGRRGEEGRGRRGGRWEGVVRVTVQHVVFSLLTSHTHTHTHTHAHTHSPPPRHFVISHLPKLSYLDDTAISVKEREAAEKVYGRRRIQAKDSPTYQVRILPPSLLSSLPPSLPLYLSLFGL